ncbi:MAG: TRAP transporter small permease [Chloroflexi bacterium]|nr:TRAP transporter small permease [Chloroflexota bacterium]
MRRLATTFQNLYSRLELIFGVVGGWVAIALMFFTVVTTLLRYLLHKPFGATLDLTELAIPAIVFLGLAYTQKMGKHLKVGLLVEHLHGRWQLSILVIALLASLFFFGMVFWYGWAYAQQNIAIGDKTAAGYPTWPSTIMIPLGSLMICVRLFLQLISLPSSAKG